MSTYCINGKEVMESDYCLLGGKALAFAKLRAYCLPIPEWFVVKNQVFYDSLKPEQLRILERGDLKAIREELKHLVFSEEFYMELSVNLGKLSGEFFAVRSSALSEDSGKTSFAGQFGSYLWISREQVIDHIKLCFLSAFSERVVEYRKNNQLQGALEVPSVIVQRMVDADYAGVCFAVNPQDADVKTSVVSAVYGLGSALVEGEVNADVYYVNKAVELDRQVIAKKNLMHIVDRNKVVVQGVPENKREKPVLKSAQAVEVAKLARKTSEIFGKYQDIEWAYEKGKLYLLQSRPITSLGQVMPVKDKAVPFDNSDFAETFNGVTLPMTFSFIRIVYAEVYRQICHICGGSKKEIKKHDRAFRNMLGLVDGRVYHNRRSWCEIISIVPAYKFSKEIVAQIVGIKEKVPEGFELSDLEESEKPELGCGLRLLWSLVMFGIQYIGLNGKIKRFYKTVEETLAEVDIKQLPYLSINELYEQISQVEGDLNVWNSAMVNEIFTMTYYEILKSLCDGWIGIDGICNELLCGQGGIISTEPAHMIWDMSRLALQDESLLKSLQIGCIGEIEEKIRDYPKLQNLVDEYMDKFGDRCLDELKMESESVRANPLLFYRSIGETAKRTTNDGGNVSDKIAKDAYVTAIEKLKGHPFRKRIFQKVLKNTGKFVKNREKVRAERTREFGHVRTILNEIGVRLASTQVLEESRDIFYLELNEVLSFIDGTCAGYHLKELVQIRKKEYEKYQTVQEVPRFIVHGQVGLAVKKTTWNRKEQKVFKNTLQGIPSSPGVIEGYARVIFDCRDAVMKEGEILVATHTDPGWVIFFNQASAVVVEYGSLLSHAAIVTREMGIPSVVAVEGATTIIHTGDKIRVDGSKGIITILDNTDQMATKTLS